MFLHLPGNLRCKKKNIIIIIPFSPGGEWGRKTWSNEKEFIHM